MDVMRCLMADIIMRAGPPREAAIGRLRFSELSPASVINNNSDGTERQPPFLVCSIVFYSR